MSPFPDAAVTEWFARRTLAPTRLDRDELVTLKNERGVTVSVCLPALNEAATIAQICTTVVAELLGPGVVDELVVVDSGSSDGTAAAAAGAGAVVHQAGSLVPLAPPITDPGKGESLWKSLSVVTGDIVVWLDADTRNFTPAFVTRLVAPLLTDPSIELVKAFYERPLQRDAITLPAEGARVTEIAIRPLLNLFFPELTGIIQPLSGEYAGRTETLRRLPFLAGYAVDIGLLVDLVERFGRDAIAQVDLGERIHRNRDVAALGRMSFEIMHALFARLDDAARVKIAGPLSDIIVQFTNPPEGQVPVGYRVTVTERPPIATFL